VGIIRRENEIEEALAEIDGFKARIKNVTVTGGRAFNPGWHLAIDLRNMLVVSECVAKAALARHESRGGHTREDYPGMNPQWRLKNLVEVLDGDEVELIEQPTPIMPTELFMLFEKSELAKYVTEEELAGLPGEPS
ncbi:MAG: fumarate reductase/succinate dehydrogenase flavoprotein subunit, partial [Actinomycetes bacterium]